jgi:predicted dehydrogenase
MAPSVADVDAIVAAAEAAGRHVLVFQPHRWCGSYLQSPSL